MAIRKFKRIMAANRGEIAIRIFRACTELGISTVAIYSEQDRLSLHRYKADEAYHVGKGKSPIDAYLGIEEIVSLARRKEIDAIHPGYGFLSENPEFAEACERAGIAFIGPTADIQRRLGDKVAGRSVALEAGVPVVPGTPKPITSEEEALLFAKQAGYPVIIKASAGGGGRGMRVVRNQQELREGLRTAASEAKAAFGNAAIFIEKFIERPKHIEVQLLGDSHGNLVHFYERDCSIQRRHQKLVEESPSPFMTPELREKMGEAAVKACTAIGYEGVGTVEFLVDKYRNFYFMEMNTRIQVEHTVTEEVIDFDLIKEQIKIAAGIPISGKNYFPEMHAIECRINAEDVYNDFRPSPGKINSFHSPKGHGVRVDTHVYAGYTISPYYDSMIAKLIVRARTRDEAITKMERALDEFIVEGIKTTIPFHQRLMRNEQFQKGDFHTGFLNTWDFKNVEL